MSVQGEYELAARFRKLVETVAHSRRKSDADSLAFAYLLTPKQADEIDRVCDENRWERVNCHAIMIKPGYIRHVLAARKDKDGLSVAEIAAVVAKAYSPRSLLRINPPKRRDEQRQEKRPSVGNPQHPAKSAAARHAVLRHRDPGDPNRRVQKVLGPGDVLSRDRGQETQNTEVTT